ncbi:MAG: GDP-mannose 4,6-dehydratase [Anaerolineae bacterium]|jgi:CDP-paratose 2-epimerase|nr:GDP-mannose 4,6-dehydratase [Anaerolineae bacterium]
MHYFVTGGAGFIGSNYVHRLLRRGEQVTVYDDLSRRGAEANLAWLSAEFGSPRSDAHDPTGRFRFVRGDVRDAELVIATAADAQVLVHLAAQVTVTTSVVRPREDLEINILGTFNVLEAARLSPLRPVVLYASTNKVYGGMEDLVVEEGATRYAYRDYPYGISEHHPLDFHSPYGCSKGAGDQYVRDYARIYDLPTIVFRQSCIYGPRQFGVEDQGWIAWFIIAAQLGNPITIYGDGKQVRDVLYVDDLLDAYDAAIERAPSSPGEIYNIGGGPENQLSVWYEFSLLLEELRGSSVPVARDTWRPGDQRIFVADIRKAERELGWRPKTDVKAGIRKLYDWVCANEALLAAYLGHEATTSSAAHATTGGQGASAHPRSDGHQVPRC